MNSGRLKARARFAGSAAILALSAGAAMAQEGVEHVVVSSTRLQAAGFDAPTPTTVISAADIEAQAKPNVFDSLKDLPALQGSTGASAQAGTTSNGLIGLSAIGMRALSPLRTLTLIDGQRVVAANLNGVVDVSMVPQMLIQRVDVVTGGASASWGSDAIAGVVNFVLDKKFEGFKANMFGGGTGYGDMGNLTIAAAAGTSFANGRGHFETSVEYSYNDGLLPRYPQNVYQHTALPGNISGRTLSRQSGIASYGSPGVFASNNTNGAPAGFPQSFYGPLRQQTTFAAYGLVNGGPKAGYTFGADSQAYPLQLAGSCQRNPNNGALVGSINNICFGTASQPGDHVNTHEFTQGLINPLTRGDIFARVSYDLTPDTNIYMTMNYSGVRTENTPAQGNSDKQGRIHCDNAYLPQTGLFGQGLTVAETQAACLAAYPTPSGSWIGGGSAGVPFGSNWSNILTNQNMHIYRQTRRFVVGADGVFELFGKDWSWNTYFQHGESNTSIKIYNMPLSNGPYVYGYEPVTGILLNAPNQSYSRFNLAQDAVYDTRGNIVCRNTIAQAYGCVPYNPFGQEPIAAGAQAYFDNQNTLGGSTNGPNVMMSNRQEAFSFAVNGSPIDSWAGPVAVAAGFEYREEHYSQRADPFAAGISWSTPATLTEPCTDPFVDCGLTSFGSLGAYNAGNYKNGRGTYHVNEAFVEVGVPLLNDSFWGKMDLTLGGRFARYQHPSLYNATNTAKLTDGGKEATTWKVGITWETPIPGIRLRALQSRDIRAPNLSELIPPRQGANGGFVNRFTNNTTSQNIIGVTAGNPALKPEVAQTVEVGIVWQPDFIPGFQTSIDYYRIGIRGAIVSLGSQVLEDLCYFEAQGQVPAGNNFCSPAVINTGNNLPQSFSNPGAPGTSGAIFAIVASPFNAATITTDGFDWEASYQFDLQDYDIPGTFVMRSLVNHTSKYILDGGVPGTQRNTERVGNVGSGENGSTYNGYGGAILNWKLQQTQSYQNDVWGMTLTERWLSGGITTNRNTLVCAPGTCPASTIQTPTINFNRVSSMFYLDVGFNYNYSENTQFYTKIDNVANTRPPDIGGQDNNQVLYDVIGRMFRFGVRINN